MQHTEKQSKKLQQQQQQQQNLITNLDASGSIPHLPTFPVVQACFLIFSIRLPFV